MKNRISHAELNLQRKLEWISRHDTKTNFVTGISIAMLGVLATASGNVKTWNCDHHITLIATMIPLIWSLVCVYQSQYPNTKSINDSLIYFGTIGAMKREDFLDKFKDSTKEEYLDDLLEQIHINSVILCQKFSYLKRSLICILIAVIPWGMFIYLSKLMIK